jgi:hypothetical protein
MKTKQVYDEKYISKLGALALIGHQYVANKLFYFIDAMSDEI